VFLRAGENVSPIFGKGKGMDLGDWRLVRQRVLEE